MTDSGTEILKRIREALTEDAPRPGHHGTPTRGKSQPSDHPDLRVQDWLPSVGEDRASQIELFAKNSVSLNTTFEVFNAPLAMSARLCEIGKAEGWKRIASHDTPLTVTLCRALNLPTLWVDNGYPVEEMEACDAGLTDCEALVAQTGSVLVTGPSSGGRALSVLPPHHVVVTTADKMIPDLPTAFAQLAETYKTDFPSFISLITGPSRTGDIERILVLGAHGPKKLTVLVLE